VRARSAAQALLVLAVAGTLAPLASGARAGLSLRGVDASAYPTVRATLVAPVASDSSPTLTENGKRVLDLTAENLASAKSVVVAVDRSRSMAGKRIADAAAGARSFVASKAASDRFAVVVFGSTAVQLTKFSTSTTDADDALNVLGVDRKSGTALNDAVAVSTRMLATEAGRARVLVLLTDGTDVSSQSSLRDALASARRAGVLVYPIGIAPSANGRAALQRMANETGGTYHDVASSSALKSVYASIAAELKRTWRLEYVTAARPGDKVHIRVALDPEGAASTDVTVPGSLAPAKPDSHPLPGVLYTPLGGLLVTLLVAFLVLTGVAFALVGSKGSWLKSRLAPHVEGPKRSKQREKGERLAAFSGLFKATEQAFSHRKPWKRVATLLERAGVPLRTVEFFYLMTGCGFVLMLLAALSGRSTIGMLIALAIGALIPYGWVSFKAKRRMYAFEDQLPDLLVTLAASLKAGHSFKQGLQTLVDEGQEPASTELGRVITDTRLGRPMDEALSETAERIGSKNFSFVITAVTIQRQVGGSLAGLFDMVADTVRQRQQFERKIRSLTAMGRASAYVLVALPFFIAIAITLLNPSYMDPLYHTSTGHMLIIVGLVMMAFGSLVLRKIVSFKG
jgi:tight adherence protein B